MIQELADSIWKNKIFQKDAKAIERAWLSNEFSLQIPAAISEEVAKKAISAAATLACSANIEHRTAALRLATYLFEIFESSELPFDSALRVVLGRLGNFPSFETRPAIRDAFSTLPLSLASEEVSAIGNKAIYIGGSEKVLTEFQYRLWLDLALGRSVAFSAPTSAGKSFVLELYLTSLFAGEKEKRCIFGSYPSIDYAGVRGTHPSVRQRSKGSSKNHHGAS